MNNKLPLEQLGKDEANKLRKRWKSGCYNFLLQRTLESFNHKKTAERRVQLESQSNVPLPLISDEALKCLYNCAVQKYIRYCNSSYGVDSGLLSTESENEFLKTLESVIASNPSLKYLEIYPSKDFSKDLDPYKKMVIGCYVPDFILFGIKKNKSSGIVIEIDGDSHKDKYGKDLLREHHLAQLKLFTFSIQNNQVRDYKYIRETLKSLYRQRSGALDKQIQRAKR